MAVFYFIGSPTTKRNCGLVRLCLDHLLLTILPKFETVVSLQLGGETHARTTAPCRRWPKVRELPLSQVATFYERREHCGHGRIIQTSTSLSKPAMSPGDTVPHYSITPHTTHLCAVCPAEPFIVCIAGAATSSYPRTGLSSVLVHSASRPWHSGPSPFRQQFLLLTSRPPVHAGALLLGPSHAGRFTLHHHPTQFGWTY